MTKPSWVRWRRADRAWSAIITLPLLGMLGMLTGCAAPAKFSQVEKQRLETTLQGTPAVVALQADNSLGVDLPLRSCFDRGHATVKPTFAKVLDRMAASQRHETTRLLVRVPADPGTRALSLAMQRAVTARDYLIERGLDASRFSVSAVTRDPMVRVVITAAAAP